MIPRIVGIKGRSIIYIYIYFSLASVLIKEYKNLELPEQPQTHLSRGMARAVSKLKRRGLGR